MVPLHCVNAAIPFNPFYRTAAQRIEPFVPWPAKEIPVSLYGVATPAQIEPGMRLKEVRTRLWGQPA